MVPTMSGLPGGIGSRWICLIAGPPDRVGERSPHVATGKPTILDRALPETVPWCSALCLHL